MSSAVNQRPSLKANLAWGTIGPLARMVIQLVSQAALARLLSPTDYGVFAVAVLVTTLVGYFSEMGGAATLVKNPEVNEQDIRVAFVLQVLIGLTASLGLYLGAGLIADLFRSPESRDVLEILALNPLLMMLGVVSMRLLAREMKFKEIQLIGLLSYALGYACLAVLMAWLDFGAYALVIGTLAQSTMQLVLAYGLARHALKPAFQAHLMWEQIRFGAQTLASGLLTWGLFSLDRLAVARLHSPAVTGLYTAGFNLAIAPPWQIVSSLQQVMFSKASKDAQSDTELVSLYGRMMFLVLTVLVPACMTLSVGAKEVVAILYGAKWEASAPIVAVLALSLPFYALAGLSTPFMWARGKVHYDVLMQAMTAVILIGAIVLVKDKGVEYIAGAVVLAYAIRSLIAVLATGRYIALGGALQLEALAWALLGIGSLLVLQPLRHWLDGSMHLNPLAALVLLGAVFAAYTIGLLMLMARFSPGAGRHHAKQTLEMARVKVHTLRRRLSAGER